MQKVAISQHWMFRVFFHLVLLLHIDNDVCMYVWGGPEKEASSGAECFKLFEDLMSIS